MDELWVGLVVVDHLNDGRVMRALYERQGDEPRRPVRRRLAGALRSLAALLAPLPVESAGGAHPAVERIAPA